MERRHRSRRSLVGVIALLITTALVVAAVIVARGADLLGAPPPQSVASVRAVPTPDRPTPPLTRAVPTATRATATPTRAAPASGQLTKEEVERKARDDSLRNLGMEMLEARVDEVTSELISTDEAGARLGIGWLPPGEPVWWVHVRGQFRYVGYAWDSSGAEGRLDTFETSERYLAYNARTGEFLSQSIAGDPFSEMPAEKRAASATMFAHDQAIAKGLLPADTPVPEPTSCPQGIDDGPLNFPLGPTPPAGLRPTNYAVVRAASGKLYTLYAGSKSDDAQQGLVLISEQVPDPCAEQKGLAPAFQATALTTPFRSGPVRVFRIESGNQVVLETPQRLRVRLDFVAQQFGATEQAQMPPTPTPFPAGGPGGLGTIQVEPRSARVEQGRAYPFSLQTHCGVDWNVDFGGSHWDLDDPAFIWDYFYAVGFNTTEGTMTLVDADHAVFTYDRAQIHFKRHQGPKWIMGCA